MTNLTLAEKDAIRASLLAYCGRYPSRNKAATSLNGVSAGTLSTILNEKYDSISDDMFRNIQAQIGRSAGWQICETTPFHEITFAISDAQDWQNIIWVVGDAGCGKTTASTTYVQNHKEVFRILCSGDMKKSDFVREIARQIGISADGYNVRDILNACIRELSAMKSPCLIIDEGDKVRDDIFYYYIDICNRLDGKAGIVFLSTPYIKKRIELGLRYNKKGYKEMFSRIGRKYFEVSPTSANDVYMVCTANGIGRKETITDIIEDTSLCDYDLRRAKRAIHRARGMSA